MVPVPMADGQTIYVHVRGEGPPVVLLHEWASDHAVWGPVIAELAREVTVYAWDARGHGRSRLVPGAGSPVVDRMAMDMAEMIAHFDLTAPAVVGHSMGALTLWAYLARFGCARLGRLCIIDQSPCLITDHDWAFGIYGDFSHQRNRQMIEHLRRDFAETVLRLIADGLNARARVQYEANTRGIQKLRQRFAGLDPIPLIACWESLTAVDYRPVLARMTAPTLLVYGGESNFYPSGTGTYVRDAAPDAVLRVYPGADHSPHVGAPQRFADDLRALLAR